MQKKILLIAVYFSLSGIAIQAQNKKNFPPPPPPPQPPVENMVAPPPPPPIPPAPPLPPIEPVEFISDVIVNNNGYEISVGKINGKQMIFLQKDGVEKKIRLSAWKANRKLYEKKYGQLPPQLPGEKTRFTPTKTVPDMQ